MIDVVEREDGGEMMGEILESGQEKRELSAGALKMIAIVAMVIDHLAFLVSPDYYSPLAGCMHLIGRLTAPLFFFFVVEGYHHTHHVGRYTLRLAVFAVVSYLPYVLFFNNGLPTSPSGWLRFSVIYTLLLGLLAVRAWHEVKNPVVAGCLVGLCILLSVFGDWYYIGVIAILLFDLLQGSLKKQRIGFCLLILLSNVMPALFQIRMGQANGHELKLLMTAGMWFGSLFPMLLLGRYNGTRGGGNKWLFYWFYPAHLLILFFAAKLLGITLNL